VAVGQIACPTNAGKPTTIMTRAGLIAQFSVVSYSKRYKLESKTNALSIKILW